MQIAIGPRTTSVQDQRISLRTYLRFPVVFFTVNVVVSYKEGQHDNGSSSKTLKTIPISMLSLVDISGKTHFSIQSS